MCVLLVFVRRREREDNLRVSAMVRSHDGGGGGGTEMGEGGNVGGIESRRGLRNLTIKGPGKWGEAMLPNSMRAIFAFVDFLLST